MGDVARDAFEGARLEAVLDAAPVPLAVDESGFAEDPQVVGEQVRGHAEVVAELAHAPRLVAEQGHDLEAGRVGEGREPPRRRCPRPFKDR